MARIASSASKVSGLARGAFSAVRSTAGIGFFLAVLAAAVFGVFKLHELARTEVAAQSRYRVPLADLRVTPPPDWLTADLLREVQSLGELPDTLNALDTKLVEQLRDAFARHPWVREVVGVRITHPTTIEVQVTYREPVALVSTARALEPIDREGVLLPAKDLSDVVTLITVSGVRSTPTGPAGSAWEDSAIEAAATLAAALAPHHEKLGIVAIDTSAWRSSKSTSGGFLYLLTEQGTRVKWGRPPGVDYPGEVSIEDKLARLEKLIADNGSLDAPAGPYEIDITHWQEITRVPRGRTPRSR